MRGFMPRFRVTLTDEETGQSIKVNVTADRERRAGEKAIDSAKNNHPDTRWKVARVVEKDE
jgi:hypothetical protein